jgi:hypothetical protein
MGSEDAGYMDRLLSRRCFGVCHPNGCNGCIAILFASDLDPMLYNNLCAPFALGLCHTDYTF